MERVSVAPRERVLVNGVEIPPSAIVAETQNHPAPDPVAARAQAVRALVIRELLLQEARRLFAQNRWAVIDVTRRSIEETAAAVVNLLNEARNQRLAQVVGAPPDDDQRGPA